jgi:aryl-alcohol dehydrogenase-like predicted oxidoreductase
VVLATKFGLISHRNGGARQLDSGPENIRAAVEGSLKRLGTDYIDLYYQHRVDPATPMVASQACCKSGGVSPRGVSILSGHLDG